MTGPSSPWPRRALARRAGVLLLSGLAACAGGSAPGGAAPRDDPCLLAQAVPPPGGMAPAGDPSPLVVGLSGPVDPSHAPAPRSEAERLVFAQLYQTLVRVDCRGEALPLLAGSWDVEDGGRRWTFHVRAGARAWNGAPVGAGDVARSWLVSMNAAAIGALTVLDDHTLRVELPGAVTPAFFARPDLAVALPDPAGDWPIGTGPYRPESAPTESASRAIFLRSGSGGRRVELRPFPGDPRNALDAGVDLLVTRDPEALDYAAAAGGYEPSALPWDRVYLLLLPAPSAPPRVAPDAADLEALARDAVREEARAAVSTAVELDACAAAAAADLGAHRGGDDDAARILYRRADPTATALARRLVALARPTVGASWASALLTVADGPVTAQGLSGTSFDEALGRGGARGYLVSLPRTTATGACELVADARRRAPWLRPGGVVPLVETRPTAVLRTGVRGISVDGTGTLLLHPVPPVGMRP